MIAYYVSAIRDGRYRALLSGPYATHDEALERVADVADLACRVDPWACFDAFGTARLTGRVVPLGLLDPRVGTHVAAVGSCRLVELNPGAAGPEAVVSSLTGLVRAPRDR